MSTRVHYNPEQFHLERLESVSARLGELVLGSSRLGSTVTAWVPIPAATVTITSNYNPNEDGTLIYESESATVALSWWDDPERGPLRPGDRVRITYAGKELFLGVVDTTECTYSFDPAGLKAGARRRTDFTATLLNAYQVAMSRQICWRFLPGETPLARISRWVTVDGAL